MRERPSRELDRIVMACGLLSGRVMRDGGNEMEARRLGRILLVDDHVEMAEMLADGLSDRGFDTMAIGSGEEAIARLEGEAFDGVVTDLRMKPIDGFAVLARSRELDLHRPVIVMTAYSAIDSAVEAVRLGATHYLAKPFKLDELATMLERALDASRLRRGPARSMP